MNTELLLTGPAVLPVRIVADVTVMWLLAGFAALLLGRCSAALRHRLWSLTMLAAVATPMAVLFLPEVRLGWVTPHENAAGNIPKSSPDLAQESPISHVPPISPTTETNSPHSANLPTPVESAPLEASPPKTMSEVETLPATGSGYLWVVVFLVPLLWQLIRISCSLGATRSLIRRAQPIAEGRATKLLALWRERLGWRGRARLLASAETSVPLSAGLWRPTVILPVDWQDWSDDALSVAIGHELAHGTRHDVAWQLVARVACAIYWFHPLAYLATWRMRIEREAACDDVVLAAGQQPAAYARVLLDLASRLSIQRLPGLALPMAARTDLEQRVQAILAGSRARSPVKRVAGLLLLAATILVLLAVGSLSPLAPEMASSAVAAADEQPTTSKAAPDAALKKDTAPKKEKDEFIRVSRIAGQAVDKDGSPIRGATIMIIAANRVLVEAETSEEGKYELINVQVPVSTVKVPWGSSSSADFSVVGTAKGFGLAWRGPIAVRTDSMRRDKNDELSGELPGWAEQIVIEPDMGATIDLSFRPASPIRGRVVDESGKPIAGVSVHPLHFIQYSTDKKAESGKMDAFVLSSFSDPRVSQPMTTDAQGSFAIRNLPKDAGVWVAVKQPGFADGDVGLTNSDRLSVDYKSSVIKVSAASEALITLRKTHTVLVKVTDSQSGLPIPSLTIQTNERFEEGGEGIRSAAQAATDDKGQVKFQLPKGKHFLFVVPDVNAPYIFRNQMVEVTGNAAKQVFTMPIRRHSQVTVRIVDAQSKKGIPGVPIWISRTNTSDGNTDLYSIFSHRPVSDESGEIKGFLSDGPLQLGLGAMRTHRLVVPEGYVAEPADNRKGREFELKDGKDLSVEFALRKKDAGEVKVEEKDTVEILGDVLDEAGKPAPNIAVTLISDWRSRASTRSSVEGKFSIRVLRANVPHLKLVARSDDGLRQGFVLYLGDTKLAPRERIVLGKPREISVTVVDAEKRPVVDALVAATSWFSKITDVKSDKDGKAVLLVPAEMPLEYVYALKPDVGLDYFMYRRRDQPANDPYRLAPDHGGPLTLTLAGVRVVRARVVDEKKQPLAGVRVNPWYVELPNKGGDFNTIWTMEVTGQDGWAEFHTIPANNTKPITFWANKEKYFAPERTHFDPAGAANEIASQLFPQARVHGIVKLADGKPAAGAVVSIDGDGYGTNNSFHTEAQCNADGQFEQYVNSDECYLFSAALDRQISKAELQVVLAGKETRRVELTLEPATRVFGTVFSPQDSKPLAGEYLTMYCRDGEDYYKLSVDEQLPNPEGSRRGLSPRVSYNATTDAQGRFEFFAGRGNYWVMGRNIQKNASQFELTGQKELQLRLEADLPPDIELSGKVIMASDKTQIVAKVDVTAVPIINDVRSPGSAKGFGVVSDAAGNFKVRRSPAELLVTARSADGRLGVLATLSADAKELELPLVPTTSARGRLVDSDTGKPLAGQRIDYAFELKYANGSSSHYYGNFTGSATSDARGEFTLAGLLVGANYRLQFVGPADRPQREMVTVGSVKVERAGVIELGDVKGKATKPKEVRSP